MKKLEPGGTHSVTVRIFAPFAIRGEEALVIEFTDVATGKIIAPVEMARVLGSEG